MELSRRSALGLGGALAAATVAAVATPAAAAAETGLDGVADVYARESGRAGGRWHSYVTAADAGSQRVLVEDDIDHVIAGASVQKLAVALAVLDKVDRGELSLGQKLTLSADTILGGSGIYRLQGSYGDELTLANILVALLLVSDNTAVRLCARVVNGSEINDILAAKGFTHTRVRPRGTNPPRFRLGTTTARETHALLKGVVDQSLLSADSSRFLLRIMRWSTVGYNDGVRRVMSSAERARVAAKYGADGDRRHEVGVIFDAGGAPALTFAFFADGLGDINNYGATHPAVQAHSVLGRAMFDAVGGVRDTRAPKRYPIGEFDLTDAV